MTSATVLGLLVALVMFDQRIRSPRALHLALPESIPVLTSIPHYRSAWRERLFRRDILLLGFILAVFMVGYLSVLVFSVMGITPEQLVDKASSLMGTGE